LYQSVVPATLAGVGHDDDELQAGRRRLRVALAVGRARPRAVVVGAAVQQVEHGVVARRVVARGQQDAHVRVGRQRGRVEPELDQARVELLGLDELERRGGGPRRGRAAEQREGGGCRRDAPPPGHLA